MIERAAHNIGFALGRQAAPGYFANASAMQPLLQELQKNAPSPSAAEAQQQK
jgi:hypothetical protein